MSTTRARVLRNTMTEPEIILWSRLKRFRSRGFHFRRQAPFGPYYLDFACFKYGLVVELDGSQHADGPRAEKDVVRDAILVREGYEVLRFWNGDVRRHLGRVLDAIELRLKEKAQAAAWRDVEVVETEVGEIGVGETYRV